MSDIRSNIFANFVATKEHKFGDLKTRIKKLSPAEIVLIRDKNEQIKDSTDMNDSMAIVYLTCRLGCPDMADLEDEFLSTLPMDEHRKMSDEIIVYSGLVQKEDAVKKG